MTGSKKWDRVCYAIIAAGIVGFAAVCGYTVCYKRMPLLPGMPSGLLLKK